jgi:purine-binding chemotaxis protein CheW
MLSVAQEMGDEVVSLCSLHTGSEVFGIDTRKIREVLGDCEVQQVPMAPAYIAGVIPNRGEVLTTVNFRALLGLPEKAGAHSVLVLEDEECRELFGLVVDSVGGVVTASGRMLELNPSTLAYRCKALFDGVYKMPAGLLIRIDPKKLRPSRLAETGLFRTNRKGE